MHFWVDVLDAAGQVTGEGPVTSATDAVLTRRMDRAGEWSISVPATDERGVTLDPKRELRLRSIGPAESGATTLAGGRIEDIQLRLHNGSAAMLEISGGDLLRELGTRRIPWLEMSGSASSILDGIMAFAPEWELERADGLPTVAVRFAGESVLGALIAMAEKGLGHFRQSGSGRRLEWFTAFEDSNIVATANGDPLALERNSLACRVISIERVEDAWELVNRAYVYGAGEGQARLALAQATHWPDGTPLVDGTLWHTTDAWGRLYTFEADRTSTPDGARSVLICQSSVAGGLGTFEDVWAYKDIAPVTNNDADVAAAGNLLLRAAVERMMRLAQTVNSYRLSVAGLQRSLFPGQTLRVVARRYVDGQRPLNIDAQLLVLETQTRIDEHGLRTVGLTVADAARWPASDAERQVESIRQAVVMESHPQMGPSQDTLCFAVDVDDDYSAEYPFFFSSNTTLVNSVRVRFKLDKFRSTVKTIGMDVDIVPTTEDEVIHAHPLVLQNGFEGATVFYDSTFGVLRTLGGGEVFTGLSNALHGHSLDLSEAIVTEYGVYEDPDDAYQANDLRFSVNGSEVLNAPESLAGDWLQLDVTELVTREDGRPAQAANTFGIEVRNEAGRRVRVTGQIELRTVIQSVAVV